MASTLKVNTIAHSGGTNAMTIDSGGRMVQSNRPVFFANAKNTANGAGTKWSTGGTAANNFTPIPFDTEIIDRTNNFDPSTFKFTVSIDSLNNTIDVIGVKLKAEFKTLSPNCS